MTDKEKEDLKGKTIKLVREYDDGYTIGVVIEFTDGTSMQVEHGRHSDYDTFSVTVY